MLGIFNHSNKHPILSNLAYNEVMQRYLSFLIVLILSVSPIVNASAPVSTCSQMASGVNAQATESISDNDYASINDCCEIQKVTCYHLNACDCDSFQANYLTLPSIQTVDYQHLDNFKFRYTSSQFRSKTPDSLYRPPIDILI